MAASKVQVFFADPPNLGNLCAITLEVINQATESQKSGSSTTGSQQISAGQPKIIKCRELIFTEHNVIATPTLMGSSIHVVMQINFYKTGKLQARLEAMGLKASKPTAVTLLVYKNCLMYTMKAKLAPLWNKVGEYLLQGRDFISDNMNHNAVKVEINLTKGEMYFAIQSQVVRVPECDIADLEISPAVMQEFKQDRNRAIEEYSIMNKWCYVLPSMKKGKVIKVTQTLLQDGAFKSYKDLKRHWKNNYGYRLPEEECKVYYHVYFKPIGESLFTYPQCCVRSRDVMVIPRHDPRPITDSFLKDVLVRVPYVCGQKLNLRNKTFHPVPQLGIVVNHAEQKNANLTDRTPRGPPVRQVPGIKTPTVHSKVTLKSGTSVTYPSWHQDSASVNASTSKTFHTENVDFIKNILEMTKPYKPVFGVPKARSMTALSAINNVGMKSVRAGPNEKRATMPMVAPRVDFMTNEDSNTQRVRRVNVKTSKNNNEQRSFGCPSDARGYGQIWPTCGPGLAKSGGSVNPQQGKAAGLTNETAVMWTTKCSSAAQNAIPEHIQQKSAVSRIPKLATEYQKTTDRLKCTRKLVRKSTLKCQHDEKAQMPTVQRKKPWIREDDFYPTFSDKRPRLEIEN